jgi:hypothetical protein
MLEREHAFNDERNEFRMQIDSLEKENKKLLDTLVRHSKGQPANQKTQMKTRMGKPLEPKSTNFERRPAT